MTIDRAVMVFAGCMILLSLTLSQVHSPYWLLLTAAVGVQLIQSAFTGFCPAAMLFKRLGSPPNSAFSEPALTGLRRPWPSDRPLPRTLQDRSAASFFHFAIEVRRFRRKGRYLNPAWLSA